MDKTGFDKEGPYSIMAHSLGCWAASFFAIRYPENIQQFMFLSPACMSRPKPDFCPEAFIQGYQSRGKRQLFTVAYYCWGKHYSPTHAFKVFGYRWAAYLHKEWMTRIRS